MSRNNDDEEPSAEPPSTPGPMRWPTEPPPMFAAPPIAWIVFAHVLGATAIGAVDCARIGSPTLSLAVVPMFAATGLVAGLVVALFERLVVGRHALLAAFVLALPTVLVTTPAAAHLFDRTTTWTVPFPEYAIVTVPVVLWIVAALVIAVGRWHLRQGDLVARAFVLVALGAVTGGIIWLERHKLGPTQVAAHVATTLVIIVLAGVAVRVARRKTIPAIITALSIGLVGGTAAASALYGLRDFGDRGMLARYGDQARDVVYLWQLAADVDRDGSSPILGGDRGD